MKKILLFLSFLLMSIGVFGTDISTSISDYANNNHWENGTKYTTIVMDIYVTATAIGGSNTGKYYTKDDSWRFYASESSELRLSTTSGNLKFITLDFSVADGGSVIYNENSIVSGEQISVSGSSCLFYITNGKVHITTISVNYDSGEDITYTVNWVANGDTIYKEENMAHDTKITNIPELDASDYCADMFIGWTNSEYYDDKRPFILFNSIEQSPLITNNTTFYSVFANFVK